MKQLFTALNSRIPVLVLVFTLAGCSAADMARQDDSAGTPLVGDTAKALLFESVAGGAAGAAINEQMDRQAAELEVSLEYATVERAAEGIAVTINAGRIFRFDASDIAAHGIPVLEKLSASLQSYENTDVIILVHTDGLGPAIYNQGLSERRAEAAAEFLASNNINPIRITAEGRGQTEPIGDNDTDEGRLKNRRVEILILANETFRMQAGGN